MNETAAPEEATETKPDTELNANPSNEGAENIETSTDEAEEEKTILIWRYGGGNRSNRPANARYQNKQKRDGKKSFGKKQGGQGHKPKPEPKERKIDPDSPFAALAALKADMKSGND